MIGCLIFGSLAAMSIARAFHHRHFYGGCHGGGWHGHRHWHGWHGGGGPDPRGGWGSFDHEDHGEFRSPFADADFRGLGGFGRGGMGAGKRFFVRRILEHVRATPAQERVISAVVEEFRDELGEERGGRGAPHAQRDRGGAPPQHLRRRAFGRTVRPPRHDLGERAQVVRRPGRQDPRCARAGAARASGRSPREGPALRRLDARGCW